MADGDVIEEGEEGTEGAEDQQEGGKKKLPLKLIIIVVVVLLVGGGAGAFFMMGDKNSSDETTSESAEKKEVAEGEEGEESDVLAEAHYFSLDPPFIVNFAGKSRARFLQVSIEGMTRDASVKESITKHFPQVRNNLVLLLSSKTYEELNSQEGKAALRKQVLKEVQKVLEAETGKEGIEDVYFTSFVMQ
jgi:flagellar protein FliL